MIETFNTHTGKIFVDRDRRLEFLVVGDYGKENNIKADFLGLNEEIKGVRHKQVDLSEKMVVTISTQHGCPMRCKFCDVHKYGYFGNVSISDLAYQVETAIRESNAERTARLNIHFARMGEPTFNENVILFSLGMLKDLSDVLICADTIHPVVSTMMPRNNWMLKDFLDAWCNIKRYYYGGEAGLQLSINSTDNDQRDEQLSGMSLSLDEISKVAGQLIAPSGRKYTLNFAVTKDTILDAKKLNAMFDKNNFIVKLTPIHQTASSIENGFDVGTTYTDFDVYKKFEEPLLELGWDVIVFVPSQEEDSDRITCGNALISRR